MIEYRTLKQNIFQMLDNNKQHRNNNNNNNNNNNKNHYVLFEKEISSKGHLHLTGLF